MEDLLLNITKECNSSKLTHVKTSAQEAYGMYYGEMYYYVLIKIIL